MKRLLATGVLIACVLFVGGANAALVRVGNLVLTANGGFTPNKLPRKTFAPIDFDGYANLKAVNGSTPPALQQVILDFDRDGRLTTAGLPVCQPAQLEGATPQEARGRCPKAIIGTGRVSGVVGLAGLLSIRTGSPLTLFNGPRQDGHPTVILHARLSVPVIQTFVITIPIERRGGLYRYRATVNVPPIAGGLGALTHLSVKIGKHYRFHGSELSYASARCGSGILRTHGRFTFADGTVIDGTVEKACTVLP